MNSKIHLNRHRLGQILGALKAQGKLIVLANGCFDLLHVGHIRFLTDARSRGDYLVVAINSDASVRRLKGEERPLMPAEERAEILAALTCVDYVTIFEEGTADALLRDLAPSLHAKGTDYEVAAIPEHQTARELGITTLICGDRKEHSTRAILAKLRPGEVTPVPRGGGARKATAKRARKKATRAKAAGAKAAGAKAARKKTARKTKARVRGKR